MEQIVVAKVSEIPPGRRKIVVPFRGLAGIGVFNVNGRFYAVRNICPHRGGPLCTGELSGRVMANGPPSSRESTILIDRIGEVLRCPWHQWAFEISTGRCLLDPQIRVATYPVRIEGHEVVVEFED